MEIADYKVCKDSQSKWSHAPRKSLLLTHSVPQMPRYAVHESGQILEMHSLRDTDGDGAGIAVGPLP